MSLGSLRQPFVLRRCRCCATAAFASLGAPLFFCSSSQNFIDYNMVVEIFSLGSTGSIQRQGSGAPASRAHRCRAPPRHRSLAEPGVQSQAYQGLPGQGAAGEESREAAWW